MRFCFALILLACQPAGSGSGTADDSEVPPADLDAAVDGSPVEDAQTQADAEGAPDVTPDGTPDLPPPVCNAGSAYAPGTPMFVERTAEWGLEGVFGTRMSVTDIDHDGYADVAIRWNGRQPDVFEGADAVRRNWLLRGTGAGFEEVGRSSGFLAVRGDYPVPLGRPMEVVVFADLDGDGDVDVYSGLDTREPVSVELAGQAVMVRESSEVLLGDGAGNFELADLGHPLRRSGLGLTDVPSGAAFTDYDRDGHVDLWMSQGGLGAPLQDRLYRNTGESFAETTVEAGLTTEEWQDVAAMNAGRGHSTAWSAAACDLNGDGWPELLAASYGRAPNHLWLANGDGTYTNRSVASGYAYDENQDWSSNQFARCYCASNRQAPGCAEVPAADINCAAAPPNWRHQFDREAFRNGGNSGTTVCSDLDGDGDLDLFTTEIKHWWAGTGSDGGEVLVNTGDPEVVFSRPGGAVTGVDIPHAGLTWDEGHIIAGVLDVDNDGRPEIYVGGTDYAGNRGRLYHNQTSEADAPRFAEVPIADFFEHNRSHGMAVADFDRDGDLDLIVGHNRARCDANAPNNCYATRQVRAFENTVGQDGNWLQLDLRGGAGSNRSAIGARVTVETDEVTQVQEVDGGHGHFGAQRDRVLHFGLGEACEAQITVRWPDAAGTTETLRLSSGHRYVLEPGTPPYVED